MSPPPEEKMVDRISTASARSAKKKKAAKKKKKTEAGRPGRVGREGRDSSEYPSEHDKYPDNEIGRVEKYLATYVVITRQEILVIAAWVLASWLVEVWDRFPHLAVLSPEKRCGKTRLLTLLEWITKTPYNTPNASPAVVYRLIQNKRPTLLLDESQTLSRRGSETAEVLKELLNAGIDRGAKVLRCGGKRFDKIEEFSIYSPKVIALIGELDGVLADRCLPVIMRRKTPEHTIERLNSRKVQPIAEELKSDLAIWAEENRSEVEEVYDKLDLIPVENDRLAELLLPLQAVLTVVDDTRLPELEAYAKRLDQQEIETQTPGVRLLSACREIFTERKSDFIATGLLIGYLEQRDHEPWYRWHRGDPISKEALARLLRPFGIKPGHNTERKKRGYHRYDFQDAWQRYLDVPSESPS